ncbi:hypothetical protein pb186bvf_004928 [Paramecium bursaria]
MKFQNKNQVVLIIQCSQLGQQEKYIGALEVQEIQNRHLVDANERHIKEICRYMLILEYKQQHIQQLDLQQKEAKENYKLNKNEQEILFPDIENKSHLTDDDKYYIEKEYQKQKNQLRKREKKQEKNKKKNEDQKHKQDDLSNKIYQ